MMTESIEVVKGRTPKKYREATRMAAALICMSFVPTEAFASDLLEVLGADAPKPDASPSHMIKAAAPKDNGTIVNRAAQGGPFEDTRSSFDPKFKALFLSWKRLDPAQAGVIAIPSAKPVPSLHTSFTSSFGTRSDPFKGTRAMHSGIDLAAPIGTKIYATADGIVGRAGVAGGYGNLIELEHGQSIQTRYGHLSAILVSPGQHVKRGDLIARMGSTGRSTGSHLHYEVRIDGRAINPIPFMQSAEYVLAAQRHGSDAQFALGGPEN